MVFSNDVFFNLAISHFKHPTDYQSMLHKMQHTVITNNKTKSKQHQLWIVEHPAVFTLGQKTGGQQHITNNDFIKNNAISVVQTDRGGQVTYHGINQVIFYCIFFLPALANKSIKQFVFNLEASVITTLTDLGISGYRIPNQPGVYVDGKKIASLGIKVKHGWSYHGIALNVDMDLKPFDAINPCGYHNLQVCNISDFIVPNKTDIVSSWQDNLLEAMGMQDLEKIISKNSV